LLSKGVDLNIKDLNGDTVIMKICKLNIVEKLVKYGAEIDAQNNAGETALMHAVKCINNVELIDFLINLGADPTIKDNKGNNLLIKSLEAGDFLFDAILELNSIDINEKNNKGYTALMMAIYNGQNRRARILLDKGANINLRSKDGLTAIDLAHKTNNDYIINYIKQKFTKKLNLGI
jgi:uncharacterized protein